MAKDVQAQPKIGILKKLAHTIQSNTDNLYKTVFYSDPSNKQSLEAIKTDITSSIKDIMTSSSDILGAPNVSKLYERLIMTQNDASLTREYERIFGNNEFVSNLTASYLDNRWVKAVDTEIDEICRYMPKLQEALDTITDNVLSADSFSKDYLNITNDLSDSKTSDEQFSRNVEDLKERYELPKLIKEIYEKESKYGEGFVYRVPYEKAIQRLMDRKNMPRPVALQTTEQGIMIESATEGKKLVPYTEHVGSLEGFSCKITVEDGIISSIVEAEMNAREKYKTLREQSIFSEGKRVDFDSGNKAYAFDDTMNSEPKEVRGKSPKHRRFDRTLGDMTELPGDEDTTADGLYNSEKNLPRIKNMNGCIVKVLKRERVVPINLNKICLGYYYFEYDSNIEMFDERLSSTGLVNTLTGIRSNHRSEAFDALQRREELLRALSNELAKKIDTKFIDANQDLKKEIYHILKYNDEFNNAAGAGTANNIRVSYIPPEDIKHLYFELDEDTGRGISDLNLSLIPAKLWVAIYVCNCLAIMTRGNDKRVYYVRQSVEANIAKTMMKTINEIKRANFGIRQIENINSVLNITGRFNDYIIPRGQDGQSPMDIEVIQGQQVEIKTDLLNLLEEAAINVTGVPIEVIQNRQSPDYATQLTMSNSKFLRFIYDRQAVFQKQISSLLTDIYNLEYGTNDRISLQLPPPLFINVTNTNQLLTNTREYCQNIAEIFMAGEQDDKLKSQLVKELVIYHLGSYLNMDVINEKIDRVMQNKTAESITSGEEDDNSSGGY